ncbi:MAG: hypothetical protein IKU84_07285 [Clostridia bacterium]|nr:hypothetical protein [Clostridia bacterium]
MLRKFLILISVLSLLSLSTQAYLGDFYLEKHIRAEKILPDKLTLVLTEGETGQVVAEVLPHGAATDIFWEISNPCATLTQQGYKCIIKATEVGDAKLTARAKDGLSFTVSVKVVPKSTKIALVSDDKIKQGESATVYARTDEGTVSWQVDGIPSEQVSFGGNLCKITPDRAGKVTVFATLNDTTVSKSLEILPAKNREVDLADWGVVLTWAGIILLLIVIIYGRGYEKGV